MSGKIPEVFTREYIIDMFRSEQYANPSGGRNVFTVAADMLEADANARAEGIRQARETALHAAVNGTGYRAVDRIIAAPDAL